MKLRSNGRVIWSCIATKQRIIYDESANIIHNPELRKAHQQNDCAVMEAYGMSVRETTEASCVAELMRRYQELTH